MSNIKKFESGAVQVKKQLPSEEVFRMDYLEGWDDMSEPKRAYLCSYFDTFPRKMRACLESGIKQGEYNKWINNDPKFTKVMELIEQIHKEELEYLDYIESYTDSKVRGRYLKNNKSKEKGSKTSYTYIDQRGNSSTFSQEEIAEAID